MGQEGNGLRPQVSVSDAEVGKSTKSPRSDSLRAEMLGHEETRRELQEIRDKYQEVQRILAVRDGDLAIARSELQRKREDTDRCANEQVQVVKDNSNLQQKVSELMLENKAFEERCQALEQNLSLLKIRHNELERLLDDNTTDRNDTQLRHEKQIEALEARLAQSEEQRQLLSKECAKDSQERELLRRQEFEDLQLAHERKTAQLEQQLREQQSDLDRQRRELERFDAASDEASAGRGRLAKVDKENRRLQEAMHEQKRVLADVESELRQDKRAGCLPSPGDFARAVRSREGESLSLQNARLLLKAKNLEHNVQVLTRHLTPAARALAQRELEGAGSFKLLGEGGLS